MEILIGGVLFSIMGIMIGWLLLSIVAGIIASNKGRSGFGFFLLSIFFTPLIGISFALAVESQLEDKNAPSPKTHVKCPDCKELIFKEARVCKHCGCKLVAPLEND